MKDLDALKQRLQVVENAVEVGSRAEVGTLKNHKQRPVPFPKFLSVPWRVQCEGKVGTI